MNRNSDSRRDEAAAQRSEGGFTLIELVISIVLLSLITGALGAAFVTSMRATSGNDQRIQASNDAQLIAAYLARDAQAAGGSNPDTGTVLDSTFGVSVNWITENAGTDPDPAACRDSNVAHQLTARFAWVDRVSSTTGNVHISKYYFLPQIGQVQGRLVRLTCVDGASDTNQTLGNRVGSSPASPTATCEPAGKCPGMPDIVQLTISENAPDPAAPPYTYKLRASLRPSSDVPTPGPGNAAAAPLVALGGGSCPKNSFSDGGFSSLRVYGGVAVGDPDPPNCPAVDWLGKNYTYTAAGDPIVGGYGDPYRSLPTPPGTCPASGGTNPPTVGGVYQPGVYPQPIPNDAALAPGVFVLCTDAPSGLHGDGVLLYLARGTVNWTGGNTQLTASTTGPWAGVVIWQPLSNTASFKVQGNAGLNLATATPAVTPAMGSVLYAPGAAVELTGTADLYLGGLIAKTILISGNHLVSIGVPPLTAPLLSGSFPPGLVGQMYSSQWTATGGSGGNVWSATGLPSGLSINGNGLISGIPGVSGSFTVLVNVTDNTGQLSNQSAVLTIDAVPTVTSTTPGFRSQGATNKTVRINGTNFLSGATVSFSGPGITLNSTTFVSATRIDVDITIDPTAPIGPRDVTVDNPGPGVATGAGVFTVIPPPSITSVTLANKVGGIPGTIELGDTITVVFSSQMSVGGFCAAWTNDANDQTRATNGDVVVTVTDGGAGSDSIAVAAASCPLFNFGSIDLGSNLYVAGGNATFSGNGGSKSTINWTAGSNTLTITLGAKTGAGVLANGGSSAPVYAASGAITDSSGVALTNSPFTAPGGSHF